MPRDNEPTLHTWYGATRIAIEAILERLERLEALILKGAPPPSTPSDKDAAP
jgi:hypothetical protein